MTTPHISVDGGGMSAAVGHFDTALSEVQSHWNSVDDQVMQLRRAWTGDASRIFTEAMDRWQAEFQNIVTQLRNMRQTLEGNSRNYNVADSNAQSQASQTANAINAGLPL